MVAWASLGVFATGCAYDEGLIIENLQGTVTLPAAALTRDLVLPDGSREAVEDVRLIGPVYLGVYPSVADANVLERYPHPELGPQYLDGVPGDAYPYGGTTIGDLRFGCIEDLTCLMVSGRYETWDSIVEWFAQLEQPLTDAGGVPIPDGEFLKQSCYDLLNVTSDAETRITAYEDRNGDDLINELDLDFVKQGDEYVADFTIWQQDYYWDRNQEDCEPGVDCTGFELWGFMDSPDVNTLAFSTCDPTQGYNSREYNRDIFSGRPQVDVLNLPSTYITNGDFVVSEPYRWNNVLDRPNLVLDFEVQ